MAESRPPIHMQSRGLSIDADTLESTSSIRLAPVQSRNSLPVDLETSGLKASHAHVPLQSRDTLSVDVESVGLDIIPSSIPLRSRDAIFVEINSSDTLGQSLHMPTDIESLDSTMSPSSIPIKSRDSTTIDVNIPALVDPTTHTPVDVKPLDSELSASSIPMGSRGNIALDVGPLDLEGLEGLRGGLPLHPRNAVTADVEISDLTYWPPSVPMQSRDTASIELQSADLDSVHSLRPLEDRDNVDINIHTPDLDLVSAEIDMPETKSRKLGPRTIGMGGKFSAPAEDLPPTLYDRSSNNPFSPLAPEDPAYYEMYETYEGEDVAMTEDDRGRDDIAYDTHEGDGLNDDPPARPTMTVPWLMPRRTDGSFSMRPQSRRGFLGDHVAGLDVGMNGYGDENGLPSVRPSPTPRSDDIRPGLGASIALSVIVGLVAIVLTVLAGLRYRRKKQNLKSAAAQDKSNRDDEVEDEDVFTGPGRNGNDVEVDEEKGLKSPAPANLGDTPRTRKGFRLWSSLPLFSPSRSQSRRQELDTPPPTRRAVLCSPSPVFSTLPTTSPGPATSPGPSSAGHSPLNKISIPDGDTIQSLMDALDSPLPLALETIEEGDEEMSLRSGSSLKDLHNRLSTASTSDSMRRISATSTYSTCSERSSMYESATDEIHTYERSNSVSSESSESSSVYLETPARIQTPILADKAVGNRLDQAGGLLLPTMPSAASIHEALDDMIGLFSPPPCGPNSRTGGIHEEEEELDGLARAAEAIGKVAFAQLQKNSLSHPITTAFDSPVQPIRPHNPLIKNPLFSLGEEEESEPSWTPTAEPCIESPRPIAPTRRHTLPIALLSRRSSIPPSPRPEQRFSELFSKDHLQRALSGIRSRQNSLPTVSESDSGPASFVQAAYKFTASMGAELQQRRMTLTTKYENAMSRPASPEPQGPTPERLALARFLASVADAEEDDEEDDFTPYWGSEDETDSRWLVYEENFPRPESGLPQIMVTCH